MSPRDDVERRSDLGDVLGELWHGTRFTVTRRGFRPPIDLVRTEDPAELHVIVDLAGIDPGGVHVVVNERALVIAGQRSRLLPEGRPSYHLLEIEYGPFERRIALPENVDPDGARATYERGLLAVVLPIAQAPPRAERVAIRIRTIA